jgi:2-desacetyl-2-hydroxyethyl bacteriochlorophyllide A dehydrogenase
VRAAVLKAPGRVALQALPDPEPAPGEVLVRVQGSGVCASELPLWEGREWFSYPRPAGEPGHEGWGVVEALGDGVAGLAPGQRVTFIGSGAHAEYAVVPAGECARHDFDEPFPGEPLACAMNAFARSGVRGGERVAVVGAGFLGLLLVQLCRGVAQEISVFSRRGSALEQARAFGATETHDSYAEAAGEESFDAVFEVTGHQEPLDLAAKLCRIRGRLVIAGYHQDGLRTVNLQLWNWRGLDVINAHEREPQRYMEGLRAAVDAAAAQRLNPAPLLTHRFGLDELAAAYAISCGRPDGFVKAVWVA